MVIPNSMACVIAITASAEQVVHLEYLLISKTIKLLQRLEKLTFTKKKLVRKPKKIFL